MANKYKIKVIPFSKYAFKYFKDSDFTNKLESVLIGNVKYINSEYNGSDELGCVNS